VKWNPPNPDMRKPPPALEEPFPWEYVNLDDIIVDLKLRPETLEIRVPRYFKVTEKRDTCFRNAIWGGRKWACVLDFIDIRGS
jgi:hypothetical protein